MSKTIARADKFGDGFMIWLNMDGVNCEIARVKTMPTEIEAARMKARILKNRKAEEERQKAEAVMRAETDEKMRLVESVSLATLKEKLTNAAPVPK